MIMNSLRECKLPPLSCEFAWHSVPVAIARRLRFDFQFSEYGLVVGLK